MLPVSFFLGICALLGLNRLWASTPETVDAAKKEGEVVWYGGGSGKEDEAVGKDSPEGIRSSKSKNSEFRARI